MNETPLLNASKSVLKDGSKVQKALTKGVFSLLGEKDIEFLSMLEGEYRLSVQDLRVVSQWLADSISWEESFLAILNGWLNDLLEANPKWQKKQIGQRLVKQGMERFNDLKARPRKYEITGVKEFQPKYRFQDYKVESNFFHVCPAMTRSEQGVCCDLQVLDVVENCAFGCTYCVLQSRFEEAEIRVPENLKERLDAIELDPNVRQHIGTGQSSDSLLWGNQNNILGDLFDFARKNPQILLELKTKSANVACLDELDIPKNVVFAWSLNPQIVINNEEHGTAGISARLAAARKLADRGAKVAFHLHPMMYFDGWEEAYGALIQDVVGMFKAEEVLWFTLGTITMPKGLDEELRQNWHHSKLLQMKTEVTPDNKTTYGKEIRLELYSHAMRFLEPWQKNRDVMIYMCMEFKDVWEKIMGYHYDTPKDLNVAKLDSAFAKIT